MNYLDRETESLTSALTRDRGDVESALRLTDIYLDLGWFDQANQAILMAEKSGRKTAQSDRLILDRRGTLAYFAGKIPEMERAARAGLEIAPGDYAFLMRLAEAERLQGRGADAQKTLERALSAASNARRVRVWSALAHLALDSHGGPPRLAAAEAAARQALAIEPNDLEANYWMGKALQGQNRSEEAIAFYEKTEKSDPAFESVTLQLGRLYQHSPDPKRREQGRTMVTERYAAIEANGRAYVNARENVRKNFGDARAHQEVAVWYLRMNREPEAILELLQALRLSPPSAEARRTRRLLAQTLRRVGRETEAVRLESVGTEAAPVPGKKK